MINQATFCANQLCEYFEVKCDAQFGDVLHVVKDDQHIDIRRYFYSSVDGKRQFLLCDCCHQAVEMVVKR